ncbi:hypothetical protein CDCA_CDCA14G3863 [Cyanidium caldarium]|uniref:Sulfotransferase n=1 Tax=Cyanidium caldarium TaxID=2771 RepID=A0AAV9IZS4_CYACA|nr:hypothetical protein CDCA_CDCA14G3863 [Cyanidium caldarium]
MHPPPPPHTTPESIPRRFVAMNSSAGSGLAKGRGTAGTAVMGSGAGGRRSSAVYLCFIAISLCALFSVFECPTADASADHHNTAANRFDSAAAAPAPPTSNKTLRWRPWHSQVSRLPLFVFVAGVEGSGHHTFGHVLERCFDVAFSFVPDIWVAQYYSWAPYTWANGSDLYEHFISNSYGVSVVGKRAILDYQHSFPFGWYRSTLFHPDLRTLIDMDGKYVDLRMIFLHRDPTETVVSAFKRGFVKDPFLQARIVEAGLMYMDRVIGLLPPDKVAVVNYNKYRANPQAYFNTVFGVAGHCSAARVKQLMEQAMRQFEAYHSVWDESRMQLNCPAGNRRQPADCTDFRAKLQKWFAARRKYWSRLETEHLPTSFG